MNAQRLDAVVLADQFEKNGFIGSHRFAQNEWCAKAAIELRRLHESAQEGWQYANKLARELEEQHQRSTIQNDQSQAKMENTNVQFVGKSNTAMQQSYTLMQPQYGKVTIHHLLK